MKYFLILSFLYAPLSWSALSSGESSSTEDCEYATQDVHTVSDKRYERLLAHLTKRTKEPEERKKRIRPTGSGYR